MIRDRSTDEGAAKRLGVEDGAVRKHSQRGSLGRDKDPDGRVLVYLGAGEDASPMMGSRQSSSAGFEGLGAQAGHRGPQAASEGRRESRPRRVFGE